MKSFVKFFGYQSLIVFCLLASMVPVVYAQGYPTRAIEVVVTAGPGGASDNFARTLQPSLAKELGVPLNISNRGGGGGVLGASYVANAKPDGYTVYIGDLSGFLIRPIMKPKTIPYTRKNFTPIAMAAEEPLILVVRPDLGINTFKEFVAYGKKNPDKLISGAVGGAPGHIDYLIMQNVAGIKMRNIEYSSGGEILTQLLGGHIDWTIGTIPVSRQHIKTGKLKIIAAVTSERLAEFPDTPTMAEEGYPDIDVNMGFCYLGPKGLTPEITAKFASSINKALKDPEAAPGMKIRGYSAKYIPPQPFAELVEKNYHKLNDVALKTPGMVEN